VRPHGARAAHVNADRATEQPCASPPRALFPCMVAVAVALAAVVAAAALAAAGCVLLVVIVAADSAAFVGPQLLCSSCHCCPRCSVCLGAATAIVTVADCLARMV